MTRVVTVLVMAMAVALSGLVVASPASAVDAPVAYTLAGARPVLATPLGTDSTGPCVADAGSGTFAYKVVRFKVDVTGTYTIAGRQRRRRRPRSGSTPARFSPATPLTNCLAFVDVDRAA